MNGFADSYRWSPGDVIFSNHLKPSKIDTPADFFVSHCHIVAAVLRRPQEHEKIESYSMLKMDGGYFELCPEVFCDGADSKNKLIPLGRLLTENGDTLFDFDTNTMLRLIGDGLSPDRLLFIKEKFNEINNWEGPKEYRRLMREKDEKQ